MSNEYDGMFNWKCPKCVTENRDDVEYAMDFTCKCVECGGEFEIYLSIEVNVDEIREVG